MRKVLLVAFAVILFTAFKYILNTSPIVTENISLNDNEIYPEKYAASDGQAYSQYYEPYRWTDTLGISKNELTTEIPIILRSMEVGKYSFDNLREYCLSNIRDLSFPIYYERAGLNQAYSRKLTFEHDNDNFLEYAKIIFSSKEGRAELFNYALSSYEKIEKHFPTTWKNYFKDVVDNGLLFTKDYTTKRSKYLALEKKYQTNYSSSFANEIGEYNAFIYRRIEHNKVPIPEINAYLNKLKTSLLKPAKEGSLNNYKNISINNGEIIISDNRINAYDGAQVKIWNGKATKPLTFSWFSHIKCLKNNGKNFYVVYYDDKNSLIDDNLKIIHTASSTVNSAATNTEEATSNKIVMTKKNGVYFIPTEVNGIAMEFIFDTGASTVSISMTEAMLLYKNGKLAKSDILGSQYFSDANGDISEGTKIILRKIKIGSKTLYNVEASVVHNLNAPLLLGQTALKKLGKIIFDTQNNTLSFE